MPATRDWLAQAECKLHPEVDFFPIGSPAGKGSTPSDYRPALAVCDSCPVVEPCLRMAIADGLREGVFGGMTPEQRRRKAGRRVHMESGAA